jgi:nitrate reductase NapD
MAEERSAYMPISGIVIRCRPELTTALAESLAREDIEIHGVLPEGQLVAVIESDSVDGEVEIVNSILNTEGVIDVRLAYHDFSDLHGNTTEGDYPVKGDS